MNLDRFTVKFFAKPGPVVDESIFIPIFHEWIRFGPIDGVLLDVADYRHVPDGPGVMLITHEINFALDHGDGRFGLLAQRKQGRDGSQAAKILELVRQAVSVADLLENDWRLDDSLRFEAGAFEFAANDRLQAPNTPASLAALLPHLQAVSAQLYPGRAVAVEPVVNDSRERLTVRFDAGQSLPLSELLAQVEALA